MIKMRTVRIIAVGLSLVAAWVFVGGPVRSSVEGVKKRVRRRRLVPLSPDVHGDVPYHPGGAL